MKKLLSKLAIMALVLGVCSFDPIGGITCDHQHDAGIKLLDNGNGPFA